MCGITGFTCLSGSVDDRVIERMTVALAHRGPDQHGYYSPPGAPHVALGAVRLQVIDPEGGDQPFRADNGEAVVVYNGEIYNAGELRRELERAGRRFRSRCDTEVALHAFLEWDTGCFERFRGMFAIAIWSPRERRLVLARDRMGIKPLYIRRIENDIVFGSELKALFAHPEVSRTLDTSALQDFLSLNYVPGRRTLVQGIEKLPAGHFLEWRDGAVSVCQWWKLTFAPDKALDEQSAAEELDGLLSAAVREHLVSDVPLGVWASGGLDSSTLVHYAAESGAKPLKTFSIAFQSKSCDERRYFRRIAEVYGTEHHEFEMRAGPELAGAIEELSYYSDGAGADAGALPVWFLSKLTRQHVTVALSGEGGDELFGGYLTYRADKLARPLRLLPKLLRKTALKTARRLLPVSDAKIGFEYKLKRWLEGSLLSADEAHLFWSGSFSLAQKQRLLPGCNGHHLTSLYDALPPSAGVGFLNRYLLLDQQYYLPDDLLYKVDRMSMAHSLEVRPALLDHRIVEFAARLPQRLKIRGSRQKAILKRVMKGKLPDEILRRPKAGLDIPAHEWLRGPLLPLLRDVLDRRTVQATRLFDCNTVDKLITDHKEKRINAGYNLWGLMTLFLWLRRWQIEIVPPEESRAPEPIEALLPAHNG